MANKNRRRWAMPGGSFLAGGLAAAALLATLELPAFEGSPLRRYLTAHDVEKVAVFLTCWGVADLLAKARRFPVETQAARRTWLPENSRLAPADAAGVLQNLEAQPPALRNTWMGRRLVAALEQVRDRDSAAGLDDCLQRLADTAADRSHSSFALVRIIAWMIPILGFLGTVVGITIAVANVSPQQLDTSLSQVTGGLAMAFDATAVALALAMGLMFAYYLTERKEGALLQEVEDRAGEGLRRLFAGGETQDPVLAPLQGVGELVLRHSEELVRRQIDLWSAALTAFDERAANAQRRQAEAILQAFAGVRVETERQSATIADAAARLDAIHDRLAMTGEALAGVGTQLAALMPLESALAENLHVLRQTQGLDEALHSLSAAIHLLTARHRPMEHPALKHAA